MSDINLIIEEAADILTKNERKSQRKKESYTPAELQEMLIIQENQKDSNRKSLNQKLLVLCQKAKEQFNLSSIPTNMMEQIALDISIQVKEGYITSIENVEKNETVVRTIQREATKVQIIENYEAEISREPIPHETIPLYVEKIGYIASKPEVAEAIKEILELSDSEIEINDVADDITLENAKESVEKIRNIKKTPQYIADRTKKFGKLFVVLEKGNSEEKKFACETTEREVYSCRLAKNPKDIQAAVDLYQSFLVDLKSKFAEPTKIASEMREKLLPTLDLTPEEIVELKETISNYERTQNPEEIENYLVENIVRRNPKVSREEVIKAAKEAANCELNPERVDKAFLEAQARIRLIDNDEFVDYCDLADQIYNLGENNNELNWAKLEEIHQKSPDLYNFTLRAMHIKTKSVQTQEIEQKTEELIDEAATERQSEVLLDRTSIRNMIDGNKNSGEIIPEALYWSFVGAVNKQPENLENLKAQMIEKIRSIGELSEQERFLQIQRIESIVTQEDAREYSLDGIERITIENGNEFDREYNREKMIPPTQKTAKEKAGEIRKEQRDEKAARARILLTPGEYDRYMETMERLKNPRLKDTVQLDLELLSHLRKVDESLYQWMLESYTKYASDNRKIEMENAIQKFQQGIRLEKFKARKAEKAAEHEETERPAEERTGIIKEDAEVAQEENKKPDVIAVTDIVVTGEENENGVLQAKNSVGQVIANVTPEDTLMETATGDIKGKSQEDEGPEL